MSQQTKAFIYQFLCFAVLFIAIRFVIDLYTNMYGIWIPLTAFVAATLLSPKFSSVRTKDGEKLFVKWMFFKGVKEIK
jgi:hypothetical protein